MDKGKKSIDNSLSQNQTYTPNVIDKQKPKSGPLYRRQVVHPRPKHCMKNQLLRLERCGRLPLMLYVNMLNKNM